MKTFLLGISFLFSSNLFSQVKTIHLDTIPIIKWDSLKTNAQYQIEDSIMQKALIGRWKDQNSILHFKKNGKLDIKYLDGGNGESGKWIITKGILNLKRQDYTKSRVETNCKILEFSFTRFRYQETVKQFGLLINYKLL